MNASLNLLDPDEPHPDGLDPRASLLAQLVGPDPDGRRRALRTARERRWVDMYGEVVVRVIIVDGSPVARQNLVYALSVSGRGHTLVLDGGEEILLVTSTHRTELDIDEWARTAAVRSGVHIVGPIGSSNLHVDEEDLQRAAADARATTELLMIVGGDTIGTTRAEDLGMWRLLHGMTGSPELVAAASPAAAELWSASDQMRRTTIEAYLDSGCSVAIACRTLFIHRTTLYYRLESMSDTVRDALADGLQRSTLHLGLKLLRLWDSTPRAQDVSPSTRAANVTLIGSRQSSKRTFTPCPRFRQVSSTPTGRVPIEAQKIDAPLTSSATFLVVTVNAGEDAAAAVREAISGIDDIIKNVGFRDLDGQLSCTVAIGSRIWSRLTVHPEPPGLHPFKEFAGAKHTAPSTSGDLLFHIRANRQDLVFEFERQLLNDLAGAVTVVDETTGFRYFDVRDLLGFVDGTANPVGSAVGESTIVGDEDADNAGGSYVVIQKYLHNLDQWQSLTTEQQEAIIGRKKADNVELDDAETGQKSHKTLSTIVLDGVEYDILRDNMPFGSPGASAFGTYFIGYSRYLWVIEKMLERMFIGDPPGLYDRMLDFSQAVTGCTFFAPSADFLSGLADDATPPAPVGPMSLDEYLELDDPASAST